MQTDSLILASMTPEAAMGLFLANSVKDDVPIDQLYVFKVNPGPGLQTRLDVYLKLDPTSISDWKYGGMTTFTYNRLDLADFFSGIDVQVSPPSFPTDVATVCGLIASVAQINFDPADFVQESISKSEALNYTLKAAPDSLRWFGSVPVNLLRQQGLQNFFSGLPRPMNPYVGDLISITADYGVGINSTITNGTIFGALLNSLQTGYTFTNRNHAVPIQWDLFNRVLNQPNTWTIDSSGGKPYNGYGATVTYNGPLQASDRPYNETLDRVCRIKLNPTYCTTQTGTLSIYYNLSRVGS
jgi:hypothetical protein